MNATNRKLKLNFLKTSKKDYDDLRMIINMFFPILFSALFCMMLSSFHANRRKRKRGRDKRFCYDTNNFWSYLHELHDFMQEQWTRRDDWNGVRRTNFQLLCFQSGLNLCTSLYCPFCSYPRMEWPIYNNKKYFITFFIIQETIIRTGFWVFW